MKRIIASNPKANLLHALERMCWSDCHKGMSHKWIIENVIKHYHITNNVCLYLRDIGFLEKRGHLYFHTGITPSKKVVEDFIHNRKVKKIESKKKTIVYSKTNIFNELSSVFQTTKEEQEFIIALRNLLNSNQTQTPTQNP